MNKYPIAWFSVVMVLGFLYASGGYQWLVVFLLGIILAKQIEILSKLDRQ